MDIYKKLLEEGKSGLEFIPSTKDWKLDTDVLGAVSAGFKPLGRLEKILESPLAKSENILYQGQILSCVHCSTAFLNMYNSYFNDNNEAFPSWLYTYSQVRHYPGGTSANEALSLVCKKGICLDKSLPAKVAVKKGERYAQNKSLVTGEMHEEAKNFKGDSYYKVRGTRKELYKALQHSPLMIGLNVGSGWNTDGIIYPKNPRFGHACVLIDFTEDGDYVTVNWWEDGKLDINILHKSYPIFWGKILVDAPDKKIIKKSNANNMKLIKGSGKEIYLLNYSDELIWICNEDTYERIIDRKKDFSRVEVISDEVLDTYKKGDSLNIYAMNLIQIIKFWAKNKKIDLEE